MKRNSRFIYEHPFREDDSDHTVRRFHDRFITITYSYDQYDRIVLARIKTRIQYKSLIHDDALFLINSGTSEAALVYQDKHVRAFKSKGRQPNYLITIL